MIGLDQTVRIFVVRVIFQVRQVDRSSAIGGTAMTFLSV